MSKIQISSYFSKLSIIGCYLSTKVIAISTLIYCFKKNDTRSYLVIVEKIENAHKQKEYKMLSGSYLSF